MTRRASAVAGLCAAATTLTGCGGPQRMLEARSTAAERIAELWWVMFGLASAVCVIVIAVLLFATYRSARRSEGEPEVNGKRLVLAGGVFGPMVILFTVLVYSYLVARDIFPPADAPDDALTIEVVGHQFWWEVRYPETGVVTANEIHLPTGTPVRFLVTAPDVIHSFWIPQLHGKIDMIPGRVHELWVTAEEAGEFRGQCAEFCGASHALMAFWTVAHEPADFERWLAQRRADTVTQERAEVVAGREVFVRYGCGYCHSAPGSPSPEVFGSPGPTLAGLSSRLTLAAGVLPNTAEALHAWITAPELVKPGVRMPPTPLPAAEMRALLAYLGSLR